MMKQKRAHELQIVRAKETLKLGHVGGPSQIQAPGIHQRMKALRQ